MLNKMLKTLLLSACLAFASAERVVYCTTEGGPFALRRNEMARLRSEGYPYPERYIYDIPQCNLTILVPDGQKLKISFVNGYSSERYAFMYAGKAMTSTTVNTALTSLENTFTFDNNVTFVMQGVPNVKNWVGFDAVISAVDSDSACPEEMIINLCCTIGPVVVEASFNNKSDEVEPPERHCTWRIFSDRTQTVKIVFQKLQINPEEQIVISGKKTQITINMTTLEPVYYFEKEPSITIRYIRQLDSYETYAVQILASASTKSSYRGVCDDDNGNQTITLGETNGVDSYVMMNHYPDMALSSYFTYRTNQDCFWSFQAVDEFELHVDVTRTVTETCCDILQMESSHGAERIDSNSDKFIVFEKNLGSPVNFTWHSDSDIELLGFDVSVTAVDCRCDEVFTDSLTLSRRSLRITSPGGDGIGRYCNNMRCSYQIFAPPGFSIVFEASGRLRNVTGDMFTIGTNETTIAIYNGTTNQNIGSESYLTGSRTLVVNFTSGELKRGSSTTSFYWSGTAKLRWVEETTFSENSTADFRTDYYISVWTITAKKYVRLHLAGTPGYTVPYLVKRGGENGTTLYDSSRLTRKLNDVSGLTSSVSQVTVMTKSGLGTRSVLILASDTEYDTGCEDSSVLFVTPEEQLISIKGQQNKTQCTTTLIASRGAGPYQDCCCWNRIELYNFTVQLGPSEEPIRVFAGVYSSVTEEQNYLLEMRGGNSDTLLNGIWFSHKIITFLVSSGAKFTGFARIPPICENSRSATGEVLGTFNSAMYGYPNYEISDAENYTLSLPVDQNVSLQITADLPSSSELVITVFSQETPIRIRNETAVNRSYSFVTSGFTISYKPCTCGERGFVLRYSSSVTETQSFF